MPAPTTNGHVKVPAKRSIKDPIYQPQRPLRVVVVGAGASGLLLAYKLQRHFGDLDLTVFEKNPAVSGTWYESIYPGCACDVPAPSYTWSFEPKTDWSANYAKASEIRQYFQDFCDRYDLQKYIELEHQVLGAEWSDEEAQWAVDVKDLRTNIQLQSTADVLISATGILNKWKWPSIPGLHSFRGKLLHSAAWDDSVDLSEKSSGIQILPAIKSQVQKLFHFVRQPTWIAPPVGEEFKEYTDEDRQRFATDPEHHLDTRRATERRMNSTFETFRSGSAMQDKARGYMQSSMFQKLGTHELSSHLIPKFPFGCRRPTPGTGYLESLSDPKVQTIVDGIDHITEDSVITKDGTVHPIDVLICATGFDTTYKPRIPIINGTGQSLSDAWATEIHGYLGLSAPNFPNYFMTLGPNCPVGNGPVLIAIEHQVSYIIQMLSKFQKENIRSFTVSSEATTAFNDWKDEFMQGTVWMQDCRSWYKAGSKSGKIVALWPGSTLHYLEVIRTPRYEDWRWEYQRGLNPWAWLGNGHSSAEKRGGDLGWYIKNCDDSVADPCLKSTTEI